MNGLLISQNLKEKDAIHMKNKREHFAPINQLYQEILIIHSPFYSLNFK